MLFLWLLSVPMYTVCHASGELDPLCVDNCKCCKDEKCESQYAWTNVCSKGCIDGHRGASCYELCKNKNCRECGFGDFNTTCTACYDGFYLGPKKDCALSCPFNCKSCTSSTTCTKCKEGFFNEAKRCNECISGHYGQNCDKPCSQYCVNNTCNRDTGKCIFGCKIGYSGDRCCIMAENCVECCTNTECKTCVSGYFKKSCNESCPGGCHGSCNISTGECIREDKPLDIALLVGEGVALTTVLLAVILVSIFLLRRRRKQREFSNDTGGIVDDTFSSNSNGERVETVRERLAVANIEEKGFPEADSEVAVLDEPNDQTQYYNFNSVNMNIKVEDLSSYVTKDHFDFLKNEFKNLMKPFNLSKRCKIAKRAEHIALNRYNGICPFDNSRVAIPGEPKFYINACYIDGYNKRKAYIASFGPTSKTTEKFNIFWRMVWHEKSDIIVMLTNLLEASVCSLKVMKCEQYWPDEKTEQCFGHVNVKSRSIKEYAEYTVRRFTLSMGKKQRNLTQMHFTAWPDKGVPSEVASLVEFRQRVKAAPVVLGGPVIVHCSAGVGRTGTYIALDILSEQGKAERLVNVFKCVNIMRGQRVNMVNTADQYIFLYKALVYTFAFGWEPKTVEEIKCLAFDVDDTFIKIFQRLNQETDNEQDEDFAARDENKRKHADKSQQYSDIPGNCDRVRLNLEMEAGNHDYINAVFINSFKIKNLFIAAQTPLSSTVEDFLCMIYQQNSCCVVALEDPLQLLEKYDVGIYLPKNNEEYTRGDYTITSSKGDTNPHFTMRQITLKNIEKEEEKIVYHFQYTKWGRGKKVADIPADFVQFIKDVQKCVNKQVTDKPNVVVHCMNGYERSGLFCVVYMLLEKAEAERHVSVVNVIRRVRAQRKLSISSVEQLKFCYQCISAYLETDGAYLNYAI